MENTTELSPAVPFPVIFFDGELEFDIGNILVHPNLGFKRFMTRISQMIGIPPHQISTSLVRQRNAISSLEIGRKVPINQSSDFAAIAKESDSFILAILKRPRRTKLRRLREQAVAIAVEAEEIVPEKTILKRYTAKGLTVDVPEAVGFRDWNYESQLQDMRRQRGRYLMFTELAYTPLAAAADAPATSREMLDTVATSSEMIAAAAKSVVCEECVAAEKAGRSNDFHRCVYDAVTVGFRSAFGPIQRPSN